MATVHVRPFVLADVPDLLELMKGLARFEGYIDDFRVTEEDLISHGLGESPAFEALVAEEVGGTSLLGMAVLYHIPWTYDLRPTLIMKELFVDPKARSKGVGGALLRRIAQRAIDIDCPRVQWTVLATNERAKRFYAEARGATDPTWEHWGLDEAALNALAGVP